MHSGSRFETSSRLGPYRIVGELASGGMGTVYRASHTLLERPAAIKVLRPELSETPEAIERFLAEARTTAAIRHPGIVEVYDYGYTTTGDAFLAMELLEGQTLGGRLAAEGHLCLFEALVLTRRIAAALAAAHECGVVHRDLKPDNVFLVRDHEGGEVDQVKLFDFGVATRDPGALAPRTGFVLGTPAYMSPEQCRGAADCDHRTDLYALGCILFELLTGEPPYGSTGTPDQLAIAHLQLPLPDVDRPGWPHEVRRLVAKLLQKRAGDRPRDALEVVATLDRCLVSRRLALPAYPELRRLTRWISSVVAGLRVRLCRRTRRGPPATGSSSRSGAETPTVVVRRPRGALAVPLSRAATQPIGLAMVVARDGESGPRWQVLE
jgi:serine/threonine-protein kinase